MLLERPPSRRFEVAQMQRTPLRHTENGTDMEDGGKGQCGADSCVLSDSLYVPLAEPHGSEVDDMETGRIRCTQTNVWQNANTRECRSSILGPHGFLASTQA